VKKALATKDSTTQTAAKVASGSGIQGARENLMETFVTHGAFGVSPILGTLGIVALGLTTVRKVRAMQADEISPGKNGPSVNLVSAPLPSIPRGEPGNVDLRFHIASGYHVNSNKPSEEFMIPTALHMDATTDIVIGRIYYPDGQNVAFDFAPDQKLSVYSGNLYGWGHGAATAHSAARKVRYARVAKNTSLRQPRLLPPKQLPVEFEVRVVKAPAAHGRRPAQSPHAHT